MTDLIPRLPRRPLRWPDAVLELRDSLHDVTGSVYIVGGAVRDAYLHRPIHDLDLVTPVSAVELGRRIANVFDGDFFVLDDERDVSRALVDTSDGRMIVDVARLRGNGLLADLLARDFTFNAMAVDLKGDLAALIDPLGGEHDLQKRILRRCSPLSLSADPIRGLRAVRQSVQFGAKIEPETANDIRAHGARLAETSPERVRDELFRLLDLAKPAAALRVADTLGLLDYVLPELAGLRGLAQSPPHTLDVWNHSLAVVEKLDRILAAISPMRTDETAATFDYGMLVMALDRYRRQLQTHLATTWPNQRSHEALLLLAALLHDAGKAGTAQKNEQGDWHFYGHESSGALLAARRAAALRLSGDEQARIAEIVQNHMRPIQKGELTPRALHRFWFQLGPAGVDVCLLALADHLGTMGVKLDQDRWIALVERIRRLLEAYYDQHDTIVRPPALLDGQELMRRLDLKPGPLIGSLLELIREGQAAGDINTVEDALKAAANYLQRHHNRSASS